VHVIASQQLYDNPGASLPKSEIVNGVHVHRVATTTFGRSALIGRGMDYASYYISMWRCARSVVHFGDIIIAKTDPPLTSVIAMRVAAQRNARFVNWLQDIYPEAAAELGVPLMRGRLGRGLCRLRDLSLRRAAANVVLGVRMSECVRARGVPPDRVHIIPNWSDDRRLRPISPDENPLRQDWELQDEFVVGYSGNLGRAHEFETVLAAASLLRDQPRILFLFIGGGHQFELLAAAVRAHGLQKKFRFIPYQDQATLAYSLNVPDAHLISLRPELEGLIVPSKLYGIAAVGRPIISITAPDGEIAQLVRQHDCGVVIEPGNGQDLAQTLIRLFTNPSVAKDMGRKARAMLESKFTREHGFARWEQMLSGLASASRGRERALAGSLGA
jgi:colanic acid biosynthesis glycosyl transferase WcaI